MCDSANLYTVVNTRQKQSFLSNNNKKDKTALKNVHNELLLRITVRI